MVGDTVVKTMGCDNSLAVAMKTCAPELAAPLAKISQYSYNTGIYLTVWKISQVCPVHEKQDKSKVVNYCPISFLSIISKVIAINNAIKQHLLSNNLLSDPQFV
eukprot:g46806.t1